MVRIVPLGVGRKLGVMALAACGSFASALAFVTIANATPGSVVGVAKISLSEGDLNSPSHELGSFGSSIAALGDLDGDGTNDIAVGAPAARVGISRSGAVHVLFLRPDGSVRSARVIAAGTGGFTGEIDSDDTFGSALVAVGDLDGDGTVEIAVGANGDDKRGVDAGAVWILFLQPDGSVSRQHKIVAKRSNPDVRAHDRFGSSLAALGDFDGNGTPDLAVGSPGFAVDEALRPGAVDLLFLEPDGGVSSRKRIEPGQNSGTYGRFGTALTSTDLDNDGTIDLVVGNPDVYAYSYDSTPSILFLKLAPDGRVKHDESVSWSGMTEPRPQGSEGDFASGLSILPDVDGDGVEDLVVGAPATSDVPSRRGSGQADLLYLGYCGSHSDGERDRGTAKALRPLDVPDLDLGDAYGASFASLGDLDGDGGIELAVGAPGDDDGSPDAGAIYILSLSGCGDDVVAGDESCDLGLMNGQPTSCCTASCAIAERHATCSQLVSSAVEITSHTGGLAIDLVRDERFGSAIVDLGDLDGDGVSDVAVGAPGAANCDDYDCGDGSDATTGGSVFILYLNPDGSVKAHDRIRPGAAGFDAPIETFDRFGSALATLGDLDGDGFGDLAVAAIGDDDGYTDDTVCDVYRGAVWILFLGPKATVRSYMKLSATSPGSNGLLSIDDLYWLGWSLAGPGDLDGDGIPDLVVGDRFAYTPSHREGALRLLLLNRDGTLREVRTIPNPELSGDGEDQRILFGSSVAYLGDLNGDGTGDLVVGAPSDDPIVDPYGYGDRGAVWILFLDDNAGLIRATKIDATAASLPGINRNDCGDTDGDGDITVRDARFALQIASVYEGCNPVICGACHLTGCCAPDTCDTNSDYVVTATDALAVLYAAIGLQTSLDCPETPTLSLDDHFGVAVTALAPNLLAVGAEEVEATFLAKDTLPSPSCGHRQAVWLLNLRDDGTVEGATRISQGGEGFGPTLSGGDEFASSLARISDVNGDGAPELAIGASRYYDRLLDLCNDPSNPRYAPPHYGSTWVVLLDPTRLKSMQ